MGEVSGWQEALVLALVVVVVQGLRRKMGAVVSVLLFAVAFPPWGWLTWWCCLTPLLVLWGDSSERRLGRDLLEAVVIGLAMGWLTTGFFEEALPSRAWLARGCGGLMFGLQLTLLPIAMRRLVGRSVVVSAVILAGVATLGEWLQSWVMMGLAWSLGSLCLPAGDTPLAQWAVWITPLGVSAMLYVINFLWLPRRSSSGRLTWHGPVLAGVLLTVAWTGGEAIASRVRVQPLSFSVMLVQPHQVPVEGQAWQPWLTLDELTRESLEKHGPVDLIVWPETSLTPSDAPGTLNDPTENQVADAGAIDEPVTLQRFQRTNQPTYDAACLVGVQLFKRVIVQRYGLDVNDVRRTNAACLIDRSGEVTTHEKLILVPLMEGLPDLLEGPWFRRHVLPYFQLEAPLKRGEDFRILEFTTEEGTAVRVAASVCYESHFPWLPQFDPANHADAVVHLLYDGHFSQHPEWAERQLLACRYRAIETRSWNLVCSTWSGSAIIDPAGRIVSRLSAEAGVLRSDQIGASSPTPSHHLEAQP